MKKMSVVMMALALSASLFSMADANFKNGMGGGGCGSCAKVDQEGAAAPFQKFQADTIDLRQEMMMKRFEIQRENLKGMPDKSKIEAIEADIKVLQGKILDVRSQSGLPTDKCDGECDGTTGVFGKKGMGGCGKGMGGCGTSPCGSGK